MLYTSSGWFSGPVIGRCWCGFRENLTALSTACIQDLADIDGSKVAADIDCRLHLRPRYGRLFVLSGVPLLVTSRGGPSGNTVTLSLSLSLSLICPHV